MLAQCGGVVSAYPAALVHNISVRGSYCPLPTTHRSNTADQEDGGRALRRHLQEVQRRTNCSDSQGPHPYRVHQLRHLAEQGVRRKVHR